MPPRSGVLRDDISSEISPWISCSAWAIVGGVASGCTSGLRILNSGVPSSSATQANGVLRLYSSGDSTFEGFLLVVDLNRETDYLFIETEARLNHMKEGDVALASSLSLFQ